MKRLNPFSRDKEGRAFAPRFPKVKDEGWFLIIGDVEANDLLALKRVNLYKGKSGRTASASHQVTFFTPEKPGRVIYNLYVISDSYLGLDQQYEICLDVSEDFNEVGL